MGLCPPPLGLCPPPLGLCPPLHRVVSSSAWGCVLLLWGCVLLLWGCVLLLWGCVLLLWGCVLLLWGCVLLLWGCVLLCMGLCPPLHGVVSSSSGRVYPPPLHGVVSSSSGLVYPPPLHGVVSFSSGLVLILHWVCMHGHRKHNVQLATRYNTTCLSIACISAMIMHIAPCVNHGRNTIIYMEEKGQPPPINVTIMHILFNLHSSFIVSSSEVARGIQRTLTPHLATDTSESYCLAGIVSVHAWCKYKCHHINTWYVYAGYLRSEVWIAETDLQKRWTNVVPS